MDKKKKVLILVAILIIIVLILRATYSKYTNEANAIVKERIGQWVIKVNDQDITENVKEFEISDFVWNWSDTSHVKEPKVAPGMTGNFNLKIDSTGTDVSIKYTITIDEAALRKIADIDLEITGVILNGEEQTLSKDENENIVIERIKKLEQIKSENETDRIDNLNVEITWKNDDTEETNKKDSIVGSVANTQITMPIKVDVIQYTGV